MLKGGGSTKLFEVPGSTQIAVVKRLRTFAKFSSVYVTILESLITEVSKKRFKKKECHILKPCVENSYYSYL